MNKALFINGIFENVMEEIFKAQKKDPSIVCYLQPHSTVKINLLKENVPNKDNSIPIYISLTTNLNLVEYVAEIINWEDKRELFKNNPQKIHQLNNHIEVYQPKEECIYEFADEEKTKACVNLLSIVNLKKITNPFSISNLIKIKDDIPLKATRTRAGGWSPVYQVPKLIEIENSGFLENIEKELDKNLIESKKLNSNDRMKRLKEAGKKPQEIQVISRAFKRNTDVIAEVLKRANGFCEKCKIKAPFIRKKDNSPYLEVHHKVLLANGGEDSIENAMGVCPNCHRELHFGV